MIALTKQQQNTFLENEAVNEHTENVLFLAKIVWDKDMIDLATKIKAEHYQEWSLSEDLYQKRTELFKKIEKLIDLTF